MKKRTRSILQELNTVGRSRNNDHLIEATGNNIIESAINLLNRIAETYDDETANELERRFLNSIRTSNRFLCVSFTKFPVVENLKICSPTIFSFGWGIFINETNFSQNSSLNNDNVVVDS